jgi:hypothetical protein
MASGRGRLAPPPKVTVVVPFEIDAVPVSYRVPEFVPMDR